MIFQPYERRVFLGQIYAPFVCRNCGEISFTASRAGTVYELTAEAYGVENSSSFGANFVVGVAGEIRTGSLGWTYHVNGAMPATPANACNVEKDASIEWRRV